MASAPTVSWEIELEEAEAVTDFLFSGSRFTEDGDSGYKIRRQLVHGRKALTNLDKLSQMLKREDMT